MPPLRMVYTRDELLRIAALASGIEVSPGIISKFNAIEVVEPAAIPKRREADIGVPGTSNDNAANFIGCGLANSVPKPSSNNGSGGGGNPNTNGNGSSGVNSANAGNGGLTHSSSTTAPLYNSRSNNGTDGRRGGNSNSNNNGRAGDDRRQSGYDRFSPPEGGRFGRGNRNQETFEFGVEYELQQSAMQKKRVTETMEREDRKGEQLKQALEKFKQVDKDAESRDTESNEADEIERLLAGITMGGDDGQPKAAARSRFFSAQAPIADPPAAPAQFSTSLPSSAPTTTAPASTSGVPPVATPPQSKVLITPTNSGTPGYVASPWGNVKSDPNLWTTAPTMASALKQSLQQQQQQQPSTTTTTQPLAVQPKAASQPPPPPPQKPPTPPMKTTTVAGSNGNVLPPPSNAPSQAAAVMNFKTAPPPAAAAVPSVSPGGASNAIAAMGFKSSVLGLSSQQSRPESASPAASANPPAPYHAWTAAELEQLLKSGRGVPTAVPPPPPHTATPSAQPGAAKVFAAAELESMLMQQARQSTAPGTVQAVVKPLQPQPTQQAPQPSQPPQPQPQQPAPPQFMTAVKTPTTMPQHSSSLMSGVLGAVPRSPPQQYPTRMKMPPSPPMMPHQQQQQQLPPPPPPPMNASQQPQAQPQPQHPWMAVPQPQQQPSQQQQQPQPQPQPQQKMQHGVRASPPQQPQQAAKMPPPPQMTPPGMAMPIMLSAQGQYFTTPPQQQPFFFSSQPVMFRRPDGTVFMQQPQPQPQLQQQPQFNPFGTNAQYLFQQQQQQQQRR